MFIGNLISDIAIGGLFVGLLSERIIHVIVFSLMWSVISLINLFIFQRDELNRFSVLVRKQETKYNLKATLNHKIVWVLIRFLSSFLISFIIGILIVTIKSLFNS